MADLWGHARVAALFCLSATLLLGGVLLGVSFAYGSQGSDFAAQVEAVEQGRLAVCTFGAALAGEPACQQTDGACLYQQPCQRRLARREHEGLATAVPDGEGARSLGSMCCAARETVLTCLCPVAFGVAVEGGGDLEANAAVVAESTTDLDRNTTEWCSEVLAAVPFTRLSTTGPRSNSWECGYTDEYDHTFSCPADVRPDHEVPCVVDAQERVLVGSKGFLVDSYGALEESTSSTASAFRTAGIVLLLLPLTPLCFMCIVTCYRGYEYREGPFGCFWRILRGQPSQPFCAPEPTSLGRA